jgi:hypothetical protein
MGLDMYLQTEQYVSDYEEKGLEVIEAIQKVNTGNLKDFKATRIIFELGYWRKANAIHGWFVRNVQEGEDKCQTSYVPLEKLQELRDVCKKILDNVDLAAELLPSTKGFFFGSYEYDEYYLRDIERTLDILDKVLSNPEAKNWWITYHASW